jgi:outer membrane receptor protein involved in Fe transport
VDFANFVGAASLNSGTISAGNRDLEPDSLWRAEAAYEVRFGKGSFLLTARREWISDLVDQLPIEVDGQIYDAVGNIGSARRDQIEAALKWPLDGLGLKGVMLDAIWTARRSRATDPSTQLRRPISKDTPREAKISLTHDIPAWHIRWGASMTFAHHKASYKISDIQTDELGERLDLFVEYKPDSRWTMRLFGRNLTDSAAIRTREIYRGVRGSSDFRYYDIRNLRSGPYIGINVQRSFGG